MFSKRSQNHCSFGPGTSLPQLVITFNVGNEAWESD